MTRAVGRRLAPLLVAVGARASTSAAPPAARILCLHGGGTSAAVMRQVQDALGIAADSQQLIFASNVLRPTDTMASKRVGDGCTLQAS